MSTFYDTPDHFHPYECNGPGHCLHCDRLVTPNHHPDHCALCQWPSEEEEMTAIQDAASKLKEIAAAIGALDFSDEAEAISEAVASIQNELQSVADALLGAEPGEEPAEPSGDENVDAAADAAAAGEEPAAEEPPVE